MKVNEVYSDSIYRALHSLFAGDDLYCVILSHQFIFCLEYSTIGSFTDHLYGVKH